MEKDRNLLTLASFAMGILMGIFDTDELEGYASFIIWSAAAVSFTLCIISTLILFPKNSDYFKGVVDNNAEIERLKKNVRRVSNMASFSFISGIFFVFALVVNESKFMVKPMPQNVHTQLEKPVESQIE